MRGRRSGVGGPLPLLSAVQVMGDGLNFPNFPNFPNFWGVRNSGKFASAAAGRGAACPPSRISGDAGVAPTNLPTPDFRQLDVTSAVTIRRSLASSYGSSSYDP